MDKIDLRLLKQQMEFFILFYFSPGNHHPGLLLRGQIDFFGSSLAAYSLIFFPTVQTHARKIKFGLLKHVGRHVQSPQL